MAGKNRANILASVLENPKILREAYEAAQKSEGSAQQELDKYLESVDGYIAKFQNAWQQLQTDFLSSDTIKTIIDFGTKVINILDEIIKRITPLGSAIAGLGLAAGGKGLAAGTLVPLLKSMIIKKETFQDFSKELSDIMGKTVTTALENTDVSPSAFSRIKDIFKSELAKQTVEVPLEIGPSIDDLVDSYTDLDGISYELIGATDMVVDNIDDMTEGVAVATQSTVGLKGGFSAVASTIGSILTGGAGVGAMILGWGAIIGSVAAGTYYLYDRFASIEGAERRAADALKKYNESKQEIENITNELQENEAKIKEIESHTPISYTDKQELKNLEDANVLLTTQLKLLEKQNEEEAKKAKDAAIGAFEKKYSEDKISTESFETRSKFDGAGEGLSEGDINGYILDIRRLTKERQEALNQLKIAQENNDLTTQEQLKKDIENYDKSISGITDKLNEAAVDLLSKRTDIQDFYNESLEKVNNNTATYDDKKVVETVNAIDETIRRVFQQTGDQKSILDLYFPKDENTNLEKTTEDFRKMAAASKEGLTTDMISRYDHLNTTLRDLGVSQQAFCDWVNATKEELEETGEAAEEAGEKISNSFDQSAFSDSMSALANLRSSYESFRENLSNGTDITFKIQDVESLRSSLQEVTEATEEVGIQAGVTKKQFDDFQKILSTSKNSKEIEDAFNNILTQWAEARLAADDYSESIQDLVKQQLVENGVTEDSAAAFVEWQTAIDNAGRTLEGMNGDINQNAANLITEADSADITAYAILQYQLEKIAAGGIDISTDAAVASLEKEINALGMDISMLEAYKRAKANKESATVKLSTLNDNSVAAHEQRKALTQMANVDLTAEAKRMAGGYMDQIQEELNNHKLSFGTAIKNGSSGGSGGGTNKAAKDAGEEAADKFKEGLEAGLSDMDSIISYITGKFDKQIDKLNDQLDKMTDKIDKAKDAAVKALNAEKAAAVAAIEAQIKVIDAQIDALNAQKAELESQTKAIDKQIKAYQKQQKAIDKEIKAIEKEQEAFDKGIETQIDGLQDVIDARQKEIDQINEVSEARQRDLALQEAEYALERQKNQRTLLLNIYGRTYSNVRVA